MKRRWLVTSASLSRCLEWGGIEGRCGTVAWLQFLGLWYAVQKTSTGSRCLTYNVTVGSEPGEYRLEQVSEHPVLGVASVDNKYHYTGELRLTADVPAKMTVNFPLSESLSLHPLQPVSYSTTALLQILHLIPL